MDLLNNSKFEIKLSDDGFCGKSVDNLTQFIIDNSLGEITLDLSGLNLFRAIKYGTLIGTKLFVISPNQSLKILVDNEEVYNNLKVLNLGNAHIELKVNSEVRVNIA